MKVVINDCFGGFSLSHEGVMRYAELKGIKLYPHINDISRGVFLKYHGREPKLEEAFIVHYTTVPTGEYEKMLAEDEKKPIEVGRYKNSNALCFSERDILRTDPCLIELVETWGAKADGKHSELKIIEIPDGVEWQIEEYDGSEWVAENHRTWR